MPMTCESLALSSRITRALSSGLRTVKEIDEFVKV